MADTRVVAGHSAQGVQILTNHIPKIIRFTVSGYYGRKWLESDVPELLFSTTVAFAYAGSAVGGLGTALTATSALARLWHNQRVEPPELRDIAVVVHRITRRYARSIGELHPTLAPIECALFGPCPRNRSLKLFRFSGTSEDDVEEVDLTPDDVVVTLGSGGDAVRQRVEELRRCANPDDVDWWIAPYRAMEQVIASGELGSVGGALQVVRVSDTDVLQVATMGDRRPIRLFGLDLDEEIGHVAGFWSPEVHIMHTLLKDFASSE